MPKLNEIFYLLENEINIEKHLATARKTRENKAIDYTKRTYK